MAIGNMSRLNRPRRKAGIVVEVGLVHDGKLVVYGPDEPWRVWAAMANEWRPAPRAVEQILACAHQPLKSRRVLEEILDEIRAVSQDFDWRVDSFRTAHSDGWIHPIQYPPCYY